MTLRGFANSSSVPPLPSFSERDEAGVLKENPLVLQKIIADKLSDKVQIMMVPSDGKYFFANDLLRGALSPPSVPTPPASE